MQVYPAAGLVGYAPYDCSKYVIDPQIPDVRHLRNMIAIPKGASEGLLELRERLST